MVVISRSYYLIFRKIRCKFVYFTKSIKREITLMFTYRCFSRIIDLINPCYEKLFAYKGLWLFYIKEMTISLTNSFYTLAYWKLSYLWSFIRIFPISPCYESSLSDEKDDDIVINNTFLHNWKIDQREDKCFNDIIHFLDQFSTRFI